MKVKVSLYKKTIIVNSKYFYTNSTCLGFPSTKSLDFNVRVLDRFYSPAISRDFHAINLRRLSFFAGIFMNVTARWYYSNY